MYISITQMLVLIIYLAVCMGVGIIAKNKGRGFWGWMLLSLLITPIIGGLIVFFMEERPAART